MSDSQTNCQFPILYPAVIAHVVSKSNIITGCSSNLKGSLITLIGSCGSMNIDIDVQREQQGAKNSALWYT